jgi:hypothetical protein
MVVVEVGRTGSFDFGEEFSFRPDVIDGPSRGNLVEQVVSPCLPRAATVDFFELSGDYRPDFCLFGALVAAIRDRQRARSWSLSKSAPVNTKTIFKPHDTNKVYSVVRNQRPFPVWRYACQVHRTNQRSIPLLVTRRN